MSCSLINRPALSRFAFAIAVLAWTALIGADIVLLASDEPFVGNPISTLLIGLAITSTVVGIQLRCHLAASADRLRLAHPTYHRPSAVGTVHVTGDRDDTGLVWARMRSGETGDQLAEVREIRQRLIRKRQVE